MPEDSISSPHLHPAGSGHTRIDGQAGAGRSPLGNPLTKLLRRFNPFPRPRFSALNLALGYIAVSIVVLTVFAAPLWFGWREAISQGRTEFLREEAVWLTDMYQKHGPEVLASTIDRRVLREPATGKIILMANAGGGRLAGNLRQWPAGVRDLPGPQPVWIDFGEGERRVVLMRVPLPDGYQLLVGRGASRFQRLENIFIWGLAGSTGIVLVLGVASGLLIRRAFMAEVHNISQTASAIVEGNLTRRLPVHGDALAGKGGDNELDMLAQTVNRMLDQIEQLIHGVRNVANAIAHDLRTPLTELRARLEGLSLSRPPMEEAYAEVEAAVADVDRVIGIFNALLRLAEIDTGARRSGFVQVDLARVLAETAEFYQPVAELKGVSLACQLPETLNVSGDPLLLTQAVVNLIDNALKFSHERGAITVAAQQRADGAVELTVADDGPGIADAEKPKVVERFYRGDASRGTPGVGLGLSLVAAVAKLHRGALELADNHPGLRASLVLFSPIA